MVKRKLVMTFLLIFLIFISVSAVSAVELNETAVENQIIEDLNENCDVLSHESTDEVIGDYNSQKTVSNIKYAFSQTGQYYGETKFHVSITNMSDSKGIEGEKVGFYVNDELWKKAATDSKGQIDLDFKKAPGNYYIEAKLLGDDELTIGSYNMNIQKIPTSISLSQTSAYYKDTKLTVKLINLKTQKPASGAKVNLKFSNGKTAEITTNSKGTASYNVPFKPGTYTVTAQTGSKYIAKNKVSMKFPIGKTYLKITSNGFSTTYNSQKTLNVKVTNYFTKHAMKKTKIILKVYTGKKYKTVTLTTNSKGTAKYDASQLNAGTHKIVISSGEKYMESEGKTVTVKVNKAKLGICAPEITASTDSAKNFKITVKNKQSNKGMKNVKVTVKVYTGKKYKTYNLKTNKNGNAVFSTEGLTASLHNVAVSVKANSNMNSATAKSRITITETETE